MDSWLSLVILAGLGFLAELSFFGGNCKFSRLCTQKNNSRVWIFLGIKRLNMRYTALDCINKWCI